MRDLNHTESMHLRRIPFLVFSTFRVRIALKIKHQKSESVPAAQEYVSYVSVVPSSAASGTKVVLQELNLLTLYGWGSIERCDADQMHSFTIPMRIRKRDPCPLSRRPLIGKRSLSSWLIDKTGRLQKS